MIQKTLATDLRVTSSPTETAVAALIMDFIKEREGKRNSNEPEDLYPLTLHHFYLLKNMDLPYNCKKIQKG